MSDFCQSFSVSVREGRSPYRESVCKDPGPLIGGAIIRCTALGAQNSELYSCAATPQSGNPSNTRFLVSFCLLEPSLAFISYIVWSMGAS
jgi:hypothetical protein